VTARLHEPHHVSGLLELLRGREIEHELRRRLGGLVAVSADDDRVFLYADTQGAAHEAERIARAVLAEDGIDAEFQVDRWHPLAEEWKPADVPLPATEAERAEEEAEAERREAEEARTTGEAEWEVRVTLHSRAEAAALEERLLGDGLPVARRWRYLSVGADTEDAASALEQEIRTKIPAEAETSVEPSVADALPRNPFAIFGGLAG
jgi:hypothetical protein